MYYFPHIPKAGGTTLRNLFYQAFGTSNCLRVWNPKAGAMIGAKDFSSFEKLSEFKVVLGHLSVESFLKNDEARLKFARGNVKIVTAVREPIDRIISLYNFIRVNPNHPMHTAMQSIDAFDFLQSQAPNFQLRFLSHCDRTDIETVFASMTILPLEKSTTLLKKHLEATQGATLKEIEPKNRTADRPGASNLLKRAMLNEDQLDKLCQIHHHDIQLHKRSLSMFGLDSTVN
ncbi:MAG: sulfotransferase family 2 domain-containing protein [Oceanicoccus sp.]